MRLPSYRRIRYLAYGIGMTAAALALAWYLNSVFDRYFQAIALILLAMLIVTLIRRMVEGGIPKNTGPVSRQSEPSQDSGEQPPPIHEETKHLPGVDHRYGWMVIPPAVTALVLLVSIFM